MSLEDQLKEYVTELASGPERIQARQVRLRLLGMLYPPKPEEEPPAPLIVSAEDLIDQNRALNDPLGLWGTSPGWRCWVGRHTECEPLGADEACTCACGLGGHKRDLNGVRTDGCNCGHEGLGIDWHLEFCVWKRTWAKMVRNAALKAAGEVEE